jgi:hypothetical protein
MGIAFSFPGCSMAGRARFLKDRTVFFDRGLSGMALRPHLAGNEPNKEKTCQ